MKKLLGIVVIYLISIAAHGHQFLTETFQQLNVTTNHIFVPVINLQLNSDQILSLDPQNKPIDYFTTRERKLKAVPRDPKLSCENQGSRTCGQFDHFSLARGAAVSACYQLGAAFPDLYPEGLIPRFIGPSSFVDGDSASADHHLGYLLAEGINFDCGYFIENLPSY